MNPHCFIGLGFQKCATTWLSMRLRRHPDLYLPIINELLFWNNFQNGRARLPAPKRYLKRWSQGLQAPNDRGKTIKLLEQLE